MKELFCGAPATIAITPPTGGLAAPTRIFSPGATANGRSVEVTSRIQRADEGTVLRCTGHNRDHSAHWRVGRADQNISTGASGIWISDAPDDGACICRNLVAAHRHAADLVGSGGSATEMLARVGVAAAVDGIDETRGSGKGRQRACGSRIGQSAIRN